MNPLSELVWSPGQGLSIKIAASSLSTRKASLRWNADTLNIVISSPQQSSGGKSADNADASSGAENMPLQLRTCSESSVRVSTASPNRRRDPDVHQSTTTRPQEQDSKCCGEINLMNNAKEVFDDDHADKVEPEEAEVSCHSIRCCKDTLHGPASRKEFMSGTAENEFHCATSVHSQRSWATNAWRARLVEAMSLRNSVLRNNTASAQPPSSLGNVGNAGNISGKLTGFLGGEQCQRSDYENKDISAIASFQFEHKLHCQTMKEENFKDDPVVARCESASGVNPRKLEKCKEKVAYSNNNCVNNTKEIDDSNESIESCTSTKILKRNHIQCSTGKMSSGSKRFRREDNESSCSGLIHRNGSSFFNWMSNLTNGLIMFDQCNAVVPLDRKSSAATEDGFVPPVSHYNNSSFPQQSVGFNSHFQSMYCHNVMITSANSSHQAKSNCAEYVPNRQTSLHCAEAFHAATEALTFNSLQMVCGGDRGNSQNQIGILPSRAQRNLKLPTSSNKYCSRSPEEKQNECCAISSNVAMGNGSGFAKSAWVSRLLPKTSMNLTDATPCNVKSDFCAVNTEGLADNLDYSSQQSLNVERRKFH